MTEVLTVDAIDNLRCGNGGAVGSKKGGRDGKGGGGSPVDTEALAKRGIEFYDDGEGARSYISEVDGNEVTVNILGGYVIFSVNDSIDFNPSIPDVTRKRIATKVARSFNADAASRPNGFKYMNSPNTGDERGDSRVRNYEKAGFSKVDSKGNQYATVKDGKLKPSTEKAYRKYWGEGGAGARQKSANAPGDDLFV